MWKYSNKFGFESGEEQKIEINKKKNKENRKNVNKWIWSTASFFMGYV